jgi:hypothetical protein
MGERSPPAPGRIRVDGEHILPLDSPSLRSGWWQPGGAALRWSYGDAMLHPPRGTRLLELRLPECPESRQGSLRGHPVLWTVAARPAPVRPHANRAGRYPAGAGLLTTVQGRACIAAVMKTSLLAARDSGMDTAGSVCTWAADLRIKAVGYHCLASRYRSDLATVMTGMADDVEMAADALENGNPFRNVCGACRPLRLREVQGTLWSGADQP